MPAPTVDRDEPIGLYEVSVNDVMALIVDVAIPDNPDPEAPADTESITAETVQLYIQLLSDDAAGRFFDSTLITDTVRSTAIHSTIRLAIINGAASYVEQAAHPAIDGVNSTSAAQVLWERYLLMCTQLEARIARWIEIGGADVIGEPGAGGGIAFSFQYPVVSDGLRW